MKVLIISATYPPARCGIGDYTGRLTQALADTGHEVHVLTSAGYTGNTSDNIMVHSQIRQWNVKDWSEIKSLIKSLSPDVVHIQYSNSRSVFLNILPFLIRYSFGIETAVTIHEHTARSLFGRARNYFTILQTRRIIVVEKKYASSFKLLLKIFNPQAKTFFIPVLSNIPAVIIGEEEKKEMRERYKAGKKKLVVYFGFIVPAKEVAKLFEVCSPDTETVVIVTDPERYRSDYSEGVKQTVASDRWKNSAFITGYLSETDVAKVLASADICLFPFAEGISDRHTSVKAALAQGTFTIGTHATRRGYDPRQNLYYVPTGDINVIRKAMDNSQSISSNFNAGQRGVQSWNQIADLHTSVYKLEESGGADSDLIQNSIV